MVLTKKYKTKLTKVTDLTDIVILALAMFEVSILKALNDGRVDKQESDMLQTLHLEVLNNLSSVGRKMAAETSSQFQKSLLEEINNLKTELRRKDAS